MKDSNLEMMTLAELWDLYQRILPILDGKLEHEKRKLDELGRKFGGYPKDIPRRRHYPRVEPKFRNPSEPSMTWSGRGLQPRWVRDALASGRNLDDFKIK